MGVLRAIEAIRVPALDAVMSYVTYGGSELIFMLVALIAFWCVSKKTGYYILIVGFFGTAVNQICKLLFQVPRPWRLWILLSQRPHPDGGGHLHLPVSLDEK